ncbi:cytochrome P450 4C1-like isoform X1 [Periplaneta americana]|uniref:cytochrome P450 4C1-like isoform X1 n=2 Tax=Periplaneta americana TaxID=6978 RepID=UPI0037E85440
MELSATLLCSVILLAILLLYLSWEAESGRMRRKIANLPRIKSYPIIGSLLPVALVPYAERWEKILEVNLANGPIFIWWMGPVPSVSIKDAKDVEVVLGNSSSQTLSKPFMYTFLHPWLGSGLLTATGSKWHTHRKILTPSFHFKILESFIPVIVEQSKILVKKLEKEVGSEGFCVQPYISRCSLDIICESAMGTAVHAQEGTSEYVNAVYDVTMAISKRVMQPLLYPDFIFNLTPLGRTHNKCLKIIHDFAKKVIQERKLLRQKSRNLVEAKEENDVGEKKRLAFLDMMLDASDGGSNLTDEEIREEVDTFMFEGHDTTATSVCWTLFILGHHMDVQEKLYEEFESIFEGSDRPPTMKDLNDMKYLERVIKESLRLYPSVPAIGRQLESDIEIGGFVIPAGMAIDINIHAIHMNPNNFPNPSKFDPDNFLPERVMKRHPFAYIAFSAGSRNCIGQKFAMLELKGMLSYVLRNYKVISLDRREDVRMLNTLVLKSNTGIRISIIRRKSSV